WQNLDLKAHGKTDSSQFSVANDEDDIIAVHLSINSTLRIPKSYSFVKKQSCRLNMDSVRRESIALYRRIIRESRRLKPHERDYYRLFARGIHERVLQDMEWILKKYTGKGLSSG
ncbi:unnamed protein product, partial [Albugo candida]